MLPGGREARVAAARALAWVGDHRWAERVRGDDEDLVRMAEVREEWVLEDLLLELGGTKALPCQGKSGATGPRVALPAQIESAITRGLYRPRVIEALGRSGDRRVAGLLVTWAEDFLTGERARWAAVAERIEHNAMVGLYGGILYGSPDVDAIRAELIVALRTLGDPCAMPFLAGHTAARGYRSGRLPWLAEDREEERRVAALAADALGHLDREVLARLPHSFEPPPRHPTENEKPRQEQEGRRSKAREERGTYPSKAIIDEGCNFEGSPDSLERTPCPTADDRNGSHA